MEPPVEKRDAYSLFFKFYRILFRQHLDTTIPRTAENMILDGDEIPKPDPSHWSHTHRLVQDWRSTRIRLSDFNTFEQFMMHILEIDLTPSLTYMKKEQSPTSPSSQKQDQQKEGLSKEQMDEAFAEIWKARKEEMTSIFEHYAKLDGVRFERDMMVYNYFLKNQHQYNILMNPPVLTAPSDPSPNVKTFATIPFQNPIVPVAATNMETIYPLTSSLAHVNNISRNQRNEKSEMEKKKPKKRRGRPVKHPNAPSRPLSAYNLFFRSEYRKMKENGEVRILENLTQRVAKYWKVAPDNVKKFFSEEARKEQVRYKQELLEFKKLYGDNGTIEKSMPSST